MKLITKKLTKIKNKPIYFLNNININSKIIKKLEKNRINQKKGGKYIKIGIFKNYKK